MGPGSTRQLCPSCRQLVAPGYYGQQGSSAQQQQQHQPQGGAFGGLPSSAGVAERGNPAMPKSKMRQSSDGRYQLPPRLRRAGRRCWIRGYYARGVPGTPSSFTYEIDIKQTVLPPAAEGRSNIVLREHPAPIACMLLTTWSSSKEAMRPPTAAAPPTDEPGVLQADGRKRHSLGGRAIRSEAEASDFAVELFIQLKLGQTRSLKDARQDPEWQLERANIPSLHHTDPAPFRPCIGQQSAEPAAKVDLSSFDVAELSHNAASRATMPAPVHARL